MEEQADPRDTACESMHLHPDKPHLLESSQPLTWVGEIVWSRILQACASPAPNTHTVSELQKFKPSAYRGGDGFREAARPCTWRSPSRGTLQAPLPGGSPSGPQALPREL